MCALPWTLELSGMDYTPHDWEEGKEFEAWMNQRINELDGC